MILVCNNHSKLPQKPKQNINTSFSYGTFSSTCKEAQDTMPLLWKRILGYSQVEN